MLINAAVEAEQPRFRLGCEATPVFVREDSRS